MNSDYSSSSEFKDKYHFPVRLGLCNNVPGNSLFLAPTGLGVSETKLA